MNKTVYCRVGDIEKTYKGKKMKAIYNLIKKELKDANISEAENEK